MILGKAIGKDTLTADESNRQNHHRPRPTAVSGTCRQKQILAINGIRLGKFRF
jgi:hypothetical protein